MALSDEALARQLQRQLDMEDAALAAAQRDRQAPRSDSHDMSSIAQAFEAYEQHMSDHCNITKTDV